MDKIEFLNTISLYISQKTVIPYNPAINTQKSIAGKNDFFKNLTNKAPAARRYIATFIRKENRFALFSEKCFLAKMIIAL